MTETSIIEKVVNKMDSPIVMMVVTVGSMVIIMSSLQGLIPAAAGSIALGLLGGYSMRPLFNTVETRTKTVTVEEIIPYNDWPNDCYGCGNTLGEKRGQFVVQTGEESNNIKAVGLCKKCTRTHSTLLDYSEKFNKLYDMRGEPEEI